MKVFVTGNLGYIGSVLTEVLHEHGHLVIGYDTGYFQDCEMMIAEKPDEQILKDIREITIQDVDGADAVIHLAALSNDPLGTLNPRLTEEINRLATVHCAKIAKAAGIQQFLFSSSCSIYGTCGDTTLTEEATFNPVSAYAVSKVLSESDLGQLASRSFSPVYLRNATAYGLAPRMRFDLVLNNLVGWALTTQKVKVMSDGSPWRPLVHIEDISLACVAILEAPPEVVHNQAFNVGKNAENYQVRDIANMVKQIIPNTEVVYTGENQRDVRTYKVDFTKIKTNLPQFQPRWNLEAGTRQLYDYFKQHGLTSEQFLSRRYTRLDKMKSLLSQHRIDSQLNWTN